MPRRTNSKKRSFTKNELVPGKWTPDSNEPPTGKLKPTRLQATAFVPRANTLQAQAKITLETHDIIFLVGPAGTAKTTMAAAQAVSDLLSGRARRLVLTRANVDAGDSIGFLPGDARMKMEIWCRAMLDGLALFLGKHQVKTMLDQELIELMPVSLIRGQSICDATVIVDEIQNLEPYQNKLMLTRIGENSRFIMTCDPGQCDLPPNKWSACEDLARFENKPGIAFVDFTNEDVTRSAACRVVLSCYNE